MSRHLDGDPVVPYTDDDLATQDEGIALYPDGRASCTWPDDCPHPDDCALGCTVPAASAAEHYYGDGCREHPAHPLGVPIAGYREPVHPRTTNRHEWPAGPVTTAVDESGCIVLYTRNGAVTITDIDAVVSALIEARAWRDAYEDVRKDH